MRYGGVPKRDTLLQALHSMWVGRKRRLSGFVDFFVRKGYISSRLLLVGCPLIYS